MFLKEPFSIDTTPAKCPHCRKELDAATNFYEQATPSVGDVTICAYCAQICVFAENGKLRKPTPKELKEFAANPEIRRLRAALALHIRDSARGN